MATYAVDGIIPAAVAKPGTEAEVADCLGQGARAGAVICPWGGGTKQDLGHRPDRVDLVLSLERLNQLIEYEPADLTVTVQAGMRLADLQELVGRHGQMLPADPPFAAAATIGGIIAAGSTGPCALAYGGPRDWLLGARVALSDGRIIRTGGRVVKNVAGYDMNKLLVGSLGTLGVITEVTVRLRPIPAARRTLLYGHADAESAMAAAEQILNSELLPTAVTVLTKGAAERVGAPGPVCLALLFEETPENVDYQADRLPPPHAGAPAGFWDDVRSYDAPVRVRVSSRISAMAALLNRPDGTEAIAHVGAGTVLLFGATLPETAGVVEKAPPHLKQGCAVWGPPRPEWQLMRALKDRFDPGHHLNRGRFVGGM